MSYLALYRKYRPSNFDDMVGQNEVIEVIRREIVSNKVSHAYLFAGPRGTGKTSTAKIMAKMVNCDELNEDGSPCGKCESCINFNASSDIVEIDAASNNGVDEIRELRDKVNLVPSNCKYKVYIIDEVHMLTTQAFNALLKTLEEPPAHVIFILATTEFYKIPVTVVSRCQKFQFTRVSNEEIISRLRFVADKENIVVEDEALYEIARLSDGGMRDAINMLDQLSSFSNNNIELGDVYKLSGTYSYDELYDLILYIFNKDFNSIITFVENVNKNGKNVSKFIEEMLAYLRDVIYYKTTSNFFSLENENISKLAGMYSVSDFYDLIIDFNNLLENIKKSSVPYVLLGISLIKIASKLFDNKVGFSSNEIVSKKVSVEALIKDDSKFEEKEKVEQIDSSFVEVPKMVSVFDEKRRQIRINNTFMSATKDKLNKMKELWKKLDSLLLDAEFGAVAGLLKDVDILVVGDENMMLLAKYDSLIERLYNQIDLIEKLIYNLCSTNYKVVFLVSDEWNYEKGKYIDNLKKGYQYVYIEEEVDDTNDTNNKVASGVDVIIDIIGEDKIEYI